MAEAKSELTDDEDRAYVGVLYHMAVSGRFPTLSDISNLMGGISVFRANRYLKALTEKGYLVEV